MTDIEKELAKHNLTKEKYASCLRDIKMKMDGVKDIDWQEIVYKYNLDIHPDTLRKASQTIFGGAFVGSFLNENNNQESYLTELRIVKNNTLKEIQKLRDEKLEYNRWLREESRDELIADKICAAIKTLPHIEIPEPIYDIEDNEKIGILCYADCHYGTEFMIKGLSGEIINEYSPEIFEKRMEELLSKTVEKITKEGFTKIKVYSLGDECDGILRASQLRKLRYGVVESTIRYADYITNWLNRLSHFCKIEFQMVVGNHTELRMLGQPKGTFVDDNMGEIIREFIKIRLKDNPNFIMTNNSSGLIYEEIFEYNVLGIHGEVKNLAEAIKTFSNIYNKKIDILIGGHMHHYKSETIGVDRDVISIPSIIGVDDYSMKIGKASNPGASFIIVEKGKGVIEQSMFKFNK